MVIETSLSREQFVRLAILRHFQRTTFYIYATLCAGLTAYALVQGTALLLLVAWVPFLLYIMVGVIGAWRASRDKASPVFLPTRYEFTPQGVAISTRRGNTNLDWDHFSEWRTMLNCYILVLTGGAILAIPQAAVPPHQTAGFEKLLTDKLGRSR